MTTAQDTHETNFRSRTMWTGDNLHIMRGMNSASIDLIYLDPPFNSNADYAAPIGSDADGAEFKDTWALSDLDVEWINLIKDKHPALNRVLLAAMSDSDKSYLVYMAVRLLEMKRLLKPSGSIYLHCDPTMSHYLKVVMDSIFWRSCFRNEVIWYYENASRGKGRWAKAHDVIFWYAMDGAGTFNRGDILTPYKSGMTKWRYERQGKEPPKGKTPDDVIVLPSLNANDKTERTGYPTQKPLALLERIVRASSNPNDMVFDPFCGCATTLVAADRLQRQWAGIDISSQAVTLVKKRLKKDMGVEGLVDEVISRTDIPQRTDLGKLPRYNSPENRELLYGKQGGNCPGCGKHFPLRNFEVDHIISRKKGGTDHIENLQLLCGACNRIKGERGMEYLRISLQL